MSRSVVLPPFVLPLLSALLVACGSPAALDRDPVPPSSLIADVRILDIETGRLSQPRDVRVEAGRIVSIRPAAPQMPGDTPMIDGQRGVLMTGLVDMHVHVLDEADLAANLAYGVTTIRNLGGMPFHLPMAERIEAGRLLGPRLISTGTILNERDGRNVNDLQTLVSGAEEARRAVQRQYRDGYRHLKLYSNLSRESFAAIRDEAARLGMTLSGHPVEGSPGDPLHMEDTLAANFQTIEHVESIVWFALQDDTDPERARALVERFATAGARVSPTLIVHQNLARIVETQGEHVERPAMASFSPVMHGFEAENYAFWAGHAHDDRSHMQSFYVELTGLMHAAGVEIVVGTDAGVMVTPHGISVSEEIELLVDAGLSPLDALQAATVNPARALGLSTEIGRVQEGYVADLVLLPGNPVDDLSNLRQPLGVMRDGVWIDADELARLREASTRHNEMKTWRRLIHHVLTR